MGALLRVCAVLATALGSGSKGAKGRAHAHTRSQHTRMYTCNVCAHRCPEGGRFFLPLCLATHPWLEAAELVPSPLIQSGWSFLSQARPGPEQEEASGLESPSPLGRQSAGTLTSRWATWTHMSSLTRPQRRLLGCERT